VIIGVWIICTSEVVMRITLLEPESTINSAPEGIIYLDVVPSTIESSITD
jgi:hypothetical protein